MNRQRWQQAQPGGRAGHPLRPAALYALTAPGSSRGQLGSVPRECRKLRHQWTQAECQTSGCRQTGSDQHACRYVRCAWLQHVIKQKGQGVNLLLFERPGPMARTAALTRQRMQRAVAVAMVGVRVAEREPAAWAEGTPRRCSESREMVGGRRRLPGPTGNAKKNSCAMHASSAGALLAHTPGKPRRPPGCSNVAGPCAPNTNAFQHLKQRPLA